MVISLTWPFWWDSIQQPGQFLLLFIHSNMFFITHLLFWANCKIRMLDTLLLLCTSLEKKGLKIFKVAKMKYTCTWFYQDCQCSSIVCCIYGCKIFLFFIKDVDKFCNSLAELYSNVSKVGDLNFVNVHVSWINYI